MKEQNHQKKFMEIETAKTQKEQNMQLSMEIFKAVKKM